MSYLKTFVIFSILRILRRPDAVEARAALFPGARGIPRMARAGELAAASRARRRRLRFGLWAPGRGAPCAQAAIYLVYTR
ncbi:hypothetical protein CE91St32_07330 [Gordonibacter pamelaeae]|nr:hypothetical protein EGYY_04890 [Eggerthella sp. YY7918]GKG89691.1 hypothetical protein CE91St32_07330 [Gordonibacter pamelaeae]